jgi:hypothetical protein
MDPKIEIRQVFRLKVATSLELQLNRNPSIEALRKSIALALGIWEYLVHKVSWFPSSSRRLGQPRRASSTSFAVDIELIVPKNTTATEMVSRTALLFSNLSAQRRTFSDTMLKDYGLLVGQITQVVPPRSFPSSVLSDKVGNIIRIPGQNGTGSDAILNVVEDGISVFVLISAIGGAAIGALLLIIGCYIFFKRRKFEA